MTLLPNGRSERAQLDSELGAAKELRQLTDAYVAHVRAIYKNLPPRQKRDIAPLMRALLETVKNTRPRL